MKSVYNGLSAYFAEATGMDILTSDQGTLESFCIDLIKSVNGTGITNLIKVNMTN